jgi:hypothetical protein
MAFGASEQATHGGPTDPNSDLRALVYASRSVDLTRPLTDRGSKRTRDRGCVKLVVHCCTCLFWLSTVLSSNAAALFSIVITPECLTR